MSEINLSLQAFQKGDPSSFNKIYQKFSGPIFNFVSKLVKDLHEAQDITSNTFFKLWKLHDRFESFQNIESFLYVTSRNACIDYFRAKKKRREVEEQLGYILKDYDPTMVEEKVAEKRAMLYEKLQTLPFQCKQIIMMRLQGKKPAEIAAELGITKHHVHVQTNIAKSKLIEILRYL